MKYVICKGIQRDDLIVWSAVAWTDVYAYGREIVQALNERGGDYALYKNDSFEPAVSPAGNGPRKNG